MGDPDLSKVDSTVTDVTVSSNNPFNLLLPLIRFIMGLANLLKTSKNPCFFWSQLADVGSLPLHLLVA